MTGIRKDAVTLVIGNKNYSSFLLVLPYADEKK